jgi:signal transduction histidine kinase
MEATAGAASVAPATSRLRGAATFGWALFGVTSLLLSVGLVLDVRTSSYRQLLYALVTAALALLGVLMTTRRPAHPISWVLAGSALVWSVGGFAYTYAIEALVTDPGSVPGGRAAAWIDNWLWLPGIVLPVALLLLLVPDGRLLSTRWRAAVVAAVGGTLLASFGLSGSPTFELVSEAPIANPLAFDATVAHAAIAVGVASLVAGVTASFVCFVLRYRHAFGDERQQLRWVGLSLGLALGLGALGTLTWGLFPYAFVLYGVAQLALPLGTAIAILKYRLYEIDLVVNRALVYGTMTLAVFVSYVVGVGLVGETLSEGSDLLLSLAVTGLVAVCFQPARERVQRFVNGLMYGERDDPYAALARLGRRLETSREPDAVLPTVVETIGHTLRLRYVAVTRTSSGAPDDRPGVVAAVFGTPDAAPLGVPLLHNGVRVGELLLAPRAGERLREADRRLLADLAPQVAAAVHAVGLTEELQTARRHLVELREEERRRIRRDLHDGLGPALAGLTFTLDAVRNVADSDLARADDLLSSATDQVQTMIGDVRRLIYGLRPPALDELGLVASLRGLASREGSRGTRVDLEAPDPLPPLGAAVEVAAYRIVQEALTNVARHARARKCAVRLSLEPRALLLEIADDGRGFSGRRIGVGLQAMRERAAELGGACEITSTPGRGTTVSARLPRQAPGEFVT